MAQIRVGFICGKDTDFVEHPGTGPQYAEIGDASFLADLPGKYRVDPESHEYLMDCPPGTKGQAHCDVALAWYIKKHNEDIEVDIITPEEITPKRLKSNDLNFTMGYNAVNISVENNSSGARKLNAFKKATNIFPTWENEDFILYKSKYMKKCMKSGVPMAPTIFAMKGARSPSKLLSQIKKRGWKHFVLKQSTSGFCLGFLKLSVEECEKDPKILANYFKEWSKIPEYIVQEAIDGFTRNWETRCFWFNGEFKYAIANMAAVSTSDQKEHIVTGDDIPSEFLENAKRIGREALKVLPRMKTAGGESVDNILVRTDIGCSDSQVFDKDTHWPFNEEKTIKTFFLNEIEPSSTTYFVRWLKFDCIPMWGELYAEKAREIFNQMQASKAKAKRASAKAKAATKKPAAKAKAKPPMKKKIIKVMSKVKARS